MFKFITDTAYKKFIHITTKHQVVLKFNNGFGASVVLCQNGLYEIMALKFIERGYTSMRFFGKKNLKSNLKPNEAVIELYNIRSAQNYGMQTQ